jgi:hypothetical protein
MLDQIVNELPDPDGYAVVMADGRFVDIWRDSKIAELVCARQPGAHGDRVVPMYFHPTKEKQMNAAVLPATRPTSIGAPMEGGFYIGAILLADGPYGLIKAPKTLGDFADVKWGPYSGSIAGALSFDDGLSNTLAMAKAGSELAQRILDLRIDGKTDWYLPALDELEIAYRACKPGATKNYMYMRSGINLHSLPPSQPHTAEDPAQTVVEIFRKGGAECFEEDPAYWASTQCAYDSDFAWYQNFDDGNQYDWRKDGRCRGCAVRRFKI